MKAPGEKKPKLLAEVLTLESLRQALNRKDALIGCETALRDELWMVCCAVFEARSGHGASWPAEAIIRSYVKPYAARVMAECGMASALAGVTTQFQYRVLSPEDPGERLRALVRARAGLETEPERYAKATWEWAREPLPVEVAEINVLPDEDVPPPAEAPALPEVPF